MKKTFTYGNGKFYMNGEPYKVMSGAIHYFRTLPEQWEDRLLKLKACGFNTVETYTCWNLHERKEGEFDFSGMLDIERFITLAEKLDLNVIVRPGPYICAEWEFGGLPSWLLSYPNIALRCDDQQYIDKVKPYYKELLARIRPHLCTNGGNVIMVQVENEYGSYGNDKIYLNKVVELYRENGIDCMLFTSDGPELWMLNGGTLPEVLSVINFGSRVKEQLQSVKLFQKDRPLMCGEFWCGWFVHWHEEWNVQRSVEEIKGDINDFFDIDASFNIYMFHGGTNFNFWNGANCRNGHYEPTITSYDYCAPLNEAGDPTPMYYAIKEAIEERSGKKAPDIEVKASEKAAYGKVKLDKTAKLFENINRISTPVHAAFPKTMEEIGQDFGYILYRTTLRGPFEELPLRFGAVHDRAIIFVNGKKIALIERSAFEEEVKLKLDFGEEIVLDILVENMGRVNYGPDLLDRKGILGGIRFGNQYHFGWDMYPMTMEELGDIAWTEEKAEGSGDPVFLKGVLTVDDEPKDTFVAFEGLTKGFCLINGFNIGRFYNPAGPQKTLYVPAPLLKRGENEIIVFESDAVNVPEVEFFDHPIY